TFRGELRWKTMGIGRRHERFGGQDPGGLMMTMLAGGRGGIHRDDNLGPQGADQPDEFLERLFLAPFAEGGGDALGVGPVELVEEIAIADAQRAETIAEFGLTQRAQRSSRLGADHVAAAFAAR